MPQFLICKMGIITIAIPRSGFVVVVVVVVAAVLMNLYI